MTTASEYAKGATTALHHVLHISPGDFDEEGTAAVIERAYETPRASVTPGRVGN